MRYYQLHGDLTRVCEHNSANATNRGNSAVSKRELVLRGSLPHFATLLNAATFEIHLPTLSFMAADTTSRV